MQLVNYLEDDYRYQPLHDQVMRYEAHWSQAAYWAYWHRDTQLTEK